MTPETQAHIDYVARLLGEIEQAKKDHDAIGLVAIGLVKGEKPRRTKLSKALEADRRLKQLQAEYYEAIDMPEVAAMVRQQKI